MSAPSRILNSFRAAMKRDLSRDGLPNEAVWNLVNLFPDILGAPLRKRGGYTYASQDISSVTATASYILAGIVAPFTDGTSVLAFDEDGRAYEIESTTGTENIGATVVTRHPAFYSNAVYVPEYAGTAPPKKITRSAGAHSITAMAGSPPNAKFALIYKDVLWLAASSASADRIWFSTAGNPEDTWDLTNKYLDNSYPITGICALNNAVFVFSLSRTTRIRGSVPPPDSDFVVDDPIFDVGCTDSRSIANYRDKMIWANAQGLYFSDGTAMDDLTAICGMKSWWLDVMGGREGFSTGSEYNASTWSIVGGIYGDYYLYSIMNGATKVDGGAVDLKRYVWMRHSNMDFVSMWPQSFPLELYAGRRGAARVARLAPFFVPVSATSADADGTAVLPILESGYVGGGDGTLKTMRAVYLTADIRDPGSSNPVLTVSYIDSPEETSYTDLSPTFGETTEITKEHFPVNQPMRGIAFKIAQTNASSDTRIYGVDLHANPREGNR